VPEKKRLAVGGLVEPHAEPLLVDVEGRVVGGGREEEEECAAPPVMPL
jgi:hypothetical protein